MTNKEKQILNFLKENPDFLISHADELNIRFDHKKIRSFSEAQLLSGREKIENMTFQLEQMYEIAEINHGLIMKLLMLNLDLLKCNTVRQILKTVSFHLAENFTLPFHTIRLINKPNNKHRVPDELILSSKDNAIPHIKKLKKPKTGNSCIHQSIYHWLPDSTQVESFLQLPLKVDQHTIGLLLIAHQDPHYFSANAPTDYVSIMADAISTSFARILGITTS